MDEIPETTPTSDPKAIDYRGMSSLGEAINDMSQKIATAARAMGRGLSQMERQVYRRQIQRANGFAMDEDSLLARRTGMGNRAIKAKKASSLGDVVRSREPRFMCPDHRERLVFSKLNQVWECPSPGCNKRKLPSMDRTDTTIIKSAPRVVGRQDEDGDIHWYLNFMEENIMVELPFQSTSATAEGASVSVTYTTDDQAVFGPRGEKIDVGQLSEPEPDTI